MTSGLAGSELGSEHRLVSGRIYSVGYEGFELPGLIHCLRDAQVRTLFDVRLTPVSRKKGFSRKTLSAELKRAGIAYVHDKDLGNPPDNRDSFRRGDGGEGRWRMREILSNGSGSALQRLVESASYERVAVLCVEREETRCHRQVITEMVREINPALEVWTIL